MKKKFILTSIALSLLLSFMLLSCNADATAGLFRQISNASAPVGIVYKQIVELDSGTLYYLTDDGLYKTDGSSSTKLVANAENNIIETAALDGTTTIAYQVNSNENEGYKTIKTVTNSGVAGPTYDFSEFDYVQLLPNGLVLVKDGNTNFYLYDFDVAPTPTLSNIGSPLISINATTGYNLSSVIQLSGKEHTSLSANPMLISFVNESGGYKHFYITGSTAAELNTSTSGFRFASMAFIDAKIYLLTDEGDLYATATPSASTFDDVHKTNKSYKENAFMYGYYDSANSVTKLITKPAGINDALYEINIDASDTVTANNVDDGYGKYLDAAEIKDSYEKGAGNLLVATLENGMYEIDIAGNTSSDPEEYTL